MNVVRMARYANRDLLGILSELMDLATKGHVTGLAVCYRMSDGTEDSRLTGCYSDSPAEGVNAAMRLSWKLTQLQDQPLPHC